MATVKKATTPRKTAAPRIPEYLVAMGARDIDDVVMMYNHHLEHLQNADTLFTSDNEFDGLRQDGQCGLKILASHLGQIESQDIRWQEIFPISSTTNLRTGAYTFEFMHKDPNAGDIVIRLVTCGRSMRNYKERSAQSLGGTTTRVDSMARQLHG